MYGNKQKKKKERIGKNFQAYEQLFSDDKIDFYYRKEKESSHPTEINLTIIC